MSLTAPQVKDFLNKWIGAYGSNSKDFFEAFAPDASIFTLSSPARVDGRENFRDAFDPNFTGDRRGQILSPDIQIYGDLAVISCHSRISLDKKVTHLRTSLCVRAGEGGKLQITHMHQSPMGVPGSAAPPAAGGADGIQLLEERVAVAAAAVGTPK